LKHIKATINIEVIVDGVHGELCATDCPYFNGEWCVCDLFPSAENLQVYDEDYRFKRVYECKKAFISERNES